VEPQQGWFFLGLLLVHRAVRLWDVRSPKEQNRTDKTRNGTVVWIRKTEGS